MNLGPAGEFVNVLTRTGAAVAAVSCGCLLLVGCSPTPVAGPPGSSATTPAGGASASSGGSGNLAACALVPRAMLQQVLGVTVPAGVEGDDSAGAPKCTYTTSDRTESVLVLTTDQPDLDMPDDSFEGVVGATRATAPGIARGIVAAMGDGRGRIFVDKGGVGVTVDIEFEYGPQHRLFASQQLQALAAAVAANLAA